MREFPQKLIDQVIDCRAEDLNAIKLSGLFCKGWLRRSRYHLFATVLLTAKNLCTFTELVVHSTLPTLTYIRHLKLRYDCRPFDGTNLALLHHCPNLTTIGIVIMYSGKGDSSAINWLAQESLHTHLRSWSANSISLSSIAELVIPADTKSFFQTIFQYTTNLRNLLFLCDYEVSNIVDILSYLPTSEWDSIHVYLHTLGQDAALSDKVDGILAEPRFRSLNDSSWA
ncbi:hypothetical protein C8R44DRAFT_866414 [Mycena epipterygia]|nr:hypothetical protein C8R44DRAFT_866414 [Mycena epipterygia]